MNNELRIKNLVKIIYFTDLIVWQEGHKLVLSIYTITKSFPREETYALVDQMRRCVISITSNIAEGFSRQSYKEKVQFYSMALGSLTELQNQLLVAKDIGYLQLKDFTTLSEQTVTVHKLMNGLIKSSRNEAPRPTSRDVVSSPLFGRAESAEAEYVRIHPRPKNVPWYSAKEDKFLTPNS